MKWRKLGKYKLPFTGQRKTHTQIPVTFIGSDGNLNILYSSRDENGMSRTFSFQIDNKDILKISNYQSTPTLDLGAVGNFDDSGVMPTWVTEHEGMYYLYYIGWNKKVSVPYQNAIGLAVSSDGLNFKKKYPGPVLDRSIFDPCFVGTACVIHEDIWRMWYLSCTEWLTVGEKKEPRYNLKYAESEDGINWLRNGKVAIDYSSPEEGGLAKASVIKINNLYHMWFCYRGIGNYRFSGSESYRIGYASSKDGVNWDRNDQLSGIDLGKEGWDSEMLCYPHIFEFNKKIYMLYNGNGFGSDGIGLAELLHD